MNKKKSLVKTKQLSEHKSIFHILNRICCSQFSPCAVSAIMSTLLSKLVLSEKGDFVSNSSGRVTETRSLVYRSKNHVSFIQVNRTDIFASLRCFHHTVTSHSSWD